MKEAIKNFIEEKAVGEGFLQDWYQSSVVDRDNPVWTDEHIAEVCGDFYLIPKESVEKLANENYIKDNELQTALYCLKAGSDRHSEVCNECILYGQTGCDHCYEDMNDIVVKVLEGILTKSYYVKGE